MTIHIYAPEPEKMNLTTRYCPTCRGDRLFLDVLLPWLGFTITCLNCGDKMGEWDCLPRPFERGWRKRRISQAWVAFYRFKGITR